LSYFKAVPTEEFTDQADRLLSHTKDLKVVKEALSILLPEGEDLGADSVDIELSEYAVMRKQFTKRKQHKKGAGNERRALP
jgi:hypothetical protein